MVGAGPAGMAAALAAREAGLDVVLLEAAPALGGQLLRTYSRVTGREGFDGAGAALAAEWTARLAAAGIGPLHRARVVALAPVTPGGWRVDLEGGGATGGREVLIATGLRPRSLGVPGESELAGRGVSASATRDREGFAGLDVVVVGGGDAAFENALLLEEAGCRVRLLARSAPRARREFRERVGSRPAIRLETGVRVTAILGDGSVEAVRVEGGGPARTLETRGVFVKIGALPNTDWCRAAIECDAEGFVRAGPGGATSADGVRAAGDVTRPRIFTVAAAEAAARAAVEALLEARGRG